MIVATADDTLARLAVGTNGHVVTADSGETGGMKWAQPGATPTQNAQTGTTYTAVLLDAGKTVTLSNASAVTLTIPAQASVSWADNTQLNFLNLGVGTVTITPAVDVTINGEPLTLETSKGGSLVRTASNTWTFIPFSAGGVDNANFTNAATGTYTDGDDYKYITFTGSGELVVDRAGFADILVIGGGGGGGTTRAGGGGSGGYLPIFNAYLPAGTLTVTVGAGGAGGLVEALSPAGQNGIASRLDSYFSAGGGGGAGADAGAGTRFKGFNGASGGGGGGGVATAGGSGTIGQGNNGGTSATESGGGGGGGNAVGLNGSGTTAGAGGAGSASLITGTSVTRAGGGGGGCRAGTAGAGGTGGGGAGSNSNATATSGSGNTGGGGGGGGLTGGGTSGAGGAGGSGVVIVRVVV